MTKAEAPLLNSPLAMISICSPSTFKVLTGFIATPKLSIKNYKGPYTTVSSEYSEGRCHFSSPLRGLPLPLFHQWLHARLATMPLPQIENHRHGLPAHRREGCPPRRDCHRPGVHEYGARRRLPAPSWPDLPASLPPPFQVRGVPSGSLPVLPVRPPSSQTPPCWVAH